MEMEGLSVICSGLGIIEEDESGKRIGYSKGEQCLENLKDLLRFLRRDDPQKREVFKQVCKWSIVSKDLIPIIEHCQDDRNLVLNSVKVLVFLTMPIESVEVPDEADVECAHIGVPPEACISVKLAAHDKGVVKVFHAYSSISSWQNSFTEIPLQITDSVC